MAWITLLPIILQYGVPFAEKLFTLWSTNAAPTQADWDALKALSSTNSTTQMLSVLAQSGIDPKSPQGQAFLALVA